MLANLKTQLKTELEKSLKESFSTEDFLPSVELEIPAEKSHGEFACNIAVKSARIFKKSPLDVAEQFREIFQKSLHNTPLQERIARIEVKKPGFINFFLTPLALYEVLGQILQEDKTYGGADFGGREKVQIELFSAKPPRPLNGGHPPQCGPRPSGSRRRCPGQYP